jgi:hypothetical protein
MDLENPEIAERLESIFMPHSAKSKIDIKEAGNKFVHYTSAENAINIISSKTLWMRSPRCMNDYMEITHGHQQLVKFFGEDEHRNKFIKALDAYEDGIAEKILVNFDECWEKIQNDTFISSISVHPKSEDEHGRLSMWRAYGEQPAKAALVLNTPPERNKKIGLILSPVAYFSYDELVNELLAVMKSIEDNSEFIKGLDRESVVGMATISLIILAVSLKHPGFKEEQEWRIIYLPNISQGNEWIKNSLETIGGVPQIIYKIPLENSHELEITGLCITEIIDKVIVGPTKFPVTVYDAFTAALEKSGVCDAGSKVVVSGIPLRT